MSQRKKIFNRTRPFVFYIVINLLLTGTALKANEMDKRLNDFFKKEKVTILVTDSGLGGLSVAAHLEANFKKWHPFKEVHIIFVNALASDTYFYNQMKDTQEKVSVFNSALFGMTKKLHPDLILIACNTLSVLYDQTAYSKRTNIPVVSIVGFGVDMLNEKLSEFPGSKAIILGTPTTIGQNAHKTGLIKKGVPEDRIRTQACPMLESEIQNDPNSDMVYTMIEMFADEALDTLKSDKENALLVGLCCTHYQYAAPVFLKVFSENSNQKTVLVDPNKRMSTFIFEQTDKQRFEATKRVVRVVSQAKLSQGDIKAISEMIEPVSLSFAKALKNYIRMKDLFTYKK